MHTLGWLIAEFDSKTVLQRSEHLKVLLGTVITVSGIVRDITADEVNLQTGDEAYYLVAPDGGADLRLPYGTWISIRYGSAELGGELLKYSHGDGVRLQVRLTDATFGTYSAHYRFNLVKIERLNTAAQRRADAARLREAEERAAALKADEERQRKVQRNIVGCALALLGAILLTVWARQFTCAQITITVVVVAMVIGLIGRIFE